MANLKNITDLPVVESAEGLNLIVNDNGSAKQIAANLVGGAASWNDLTDKPFYEEAEVVDIFVGETFTLEYEEPSATAFSPKTKYNLEEGTVCNFVINGVTYNDIVIASGQTRFEGYTIIANNGWIYAPVGTTSLTVSLAVKSATLKQIDEKYIPDSVKGMVFEVADSEIQQTNSTAFTITKNYDPLYEAVMAGKFVYIKLPFAYIVPVAIYIENYGADGYLRVVTGAIPNIEGNPHGSLKFINGSYHDAI